MWEKSKITEGKGGHYPLPVRAKLRLSKKGSTTSYDDNGEPKVGIHL